MASGLRHRSTQQTEFAQSAPTVTGAGSASSYLGVECNDQADDNGNQRRRHSVPSVFAPTAGTRSSWNFSEPNDSTNGPSWKHKLALVSGLLLLAAPWIRHSSIQWKVGSLQEELMALQKDQKMLQNSLKSQTDALKQVQEEAKAQKKKNKKLLAQLKDYGSNFEDFDSDHYEEAEQIENDYLKRVHELQHEVTRSSERQLVGEGYRLLGSAEAIRVEITLDKQVGDIGNKLIMELHPANLMPHTIGFFLDMVERKNYYDNLVLMHRKAGSNVVYSVPMDRETMKLDTNDFMHKGRPVVHPGAVDAHDTLLREDDFILHQLATLEYEQDYPIEKYSAVFIDHGPHFYINMGDTPNNKKDVCFAKVIEGQAILEYIVNHESDSSHSMFMVGIESVKILNKPTTIGKAPRSQSAVV